MSYLRRLLTKSRAPGSRLTARRLPPFATTETHIEERDEDVLVSAPAPARASREGERPLAAEAYRASPESLALEREVRAARPGDGDRALISPEPAERSAERATDVRPEAPSRRRLKRIVVEHRRGVTHARSEALPETIDDRPLIDVAEPSNEPARRGAAVRAAAPVVRDIPAIVQRSSADVAPSTVVNVVIGRIEVRAASAAPAKEPRAEPFRPKISLEAYLARGTGAT